jgi:hypothetical protein
MKRSIEHLGSVEQGTSKKQRTSKSTPPPQDTTLKYSLRRSVCDNIAQASNAPCTREGISTVRYSLEENEHLQEQGNPLQELAAVSFVETPGHHLKHNKNNIILHAETNTPKRTPLLLKKKNVTRINNNTASCNTTTATSITCITSNKKKSTTLLEVSEDVLVYHLIPYLNTFEKWRLGNTSKRVRSLVYRPCNWKHITIDRAEFPMIQDPMHKLDLRFKRTIDSILSKCYQNYTHPFESISITYNDSLYISRNVLQIFCSDPERWHLLPHESYIQDHHTRVTIINTFMMAPNLKILTLEGITQIQLARVLYAVSSNIQELKIKNISVAKGKMEIPRGNSQLQHVHMMDCPKLLNIRFMSWFFKLLSCTKYTIQVDRIILVEFLYVLSRSMNRSHTGKRKLEFHICTRSMSIGPDIVLQVEKMLADSLFSNVSLFLSCEQYDVIQKYHKSLAEYKKRLGAHITLKPYY